MVFFLGLLIAGGLLGSAVPSLSQTEAARRQPATGYTMDEVGFPSGDLTLHGTVLVPDGAGPWPAIALVHGAGRGLREENLDIAVAFARSGVLTLAYDKRTAGYAANGVGGRDYDLLAGDALAAIDLLQRRPDVQTGMVGLWGLSEGGWVAPLAAARSAEVAFLVLVGASALPPAQQEGWRHEHLLRHAGVTGSLLETIPRDLMHLLATTELLAEATYDPVLTLERVHQPVLAVWGEQERTGPPAESAQLMAAALAGAGNPSVTLEIIPGANHDLKLATDDGFGGQPEYAPAYLELVTAWVNQVAAGNPPPSSTAELPIQHFLSWPGAANPPGILSGGWLQLIAFLVLLLAFPLFSLLGLVRRGHPAPVTVRAPARWLAVTAWIVTLGLYGYLFGFIIGGIPALGPIVLGRPVPWLLLQMLSFLAVVFSVTLIVSWFQTRPPLAGLDRIRFQVLLTGALVFVPWALYWGLLTP
ncbi:MAG: alpha/beta hydrolase [Chloroflexota bacterium]|nr:alpha/beta hydrolase [Chloroflexota bacterium]